MKNKNIYITLMLLCISTYIIAQNTKTDKISDIIKVNEYNNINDKNNENIKAGNDNVRIKEDRDDEEYEDQAKSRKKLSDSHITGHIIDKSTGEHLPYATIALKGTTIGIASDATGHYFLKNLPIGKYNLEVKMIGYKTINKEVEIIAKNTLELNFEMEEDNVSLEQIVVSSSRTETKRKNSPSLVNISDSKIFALTNSNNLAEGLVFQPGLRVEDNCQNCGFTQVRINGLDGHYSQILMDSRPIFSALTGVYGLEQIPSNMIERVEVVRGGGSALFGSSAIGGTINIITKDPNRNSAEISHSIMSLGLTNNYDNNTTMNASVISDNYKAGLFVYGQKRHKSSYDHDDDGFSEIPFLSSQTIGIRTFLKTGTYSKLNIQYHGIKEFRRGGDLLDRPAHEANITEQVDHNINGGGISFDLFSKSYNGHLNVFTSFQNTERDSYYGSKQDPNAYGMTKDLVIVSGAQYSHNLDHFIFMPSEAVIGIEYNYNNLHDKSIGYEHDVQQIVKTFSAYLQNEWKNDTWGILIGARVDKHNLIDNIIVSPRVNFRYNPSEKVNFRLSYSTGFRAPQAFDEDFHVAVVGGERVVTILAEDLKEEKSQSLSLSSDLYFNIGKVSNNLLVEGFYTKLKDIFTTRSLDKQDDKGNDIIERYNGSGAYVYGVNIEAKTIVSSKIEFQAGVTLQKSEYKKAEAWSENPEVAKEKKMFRTPDTYGYITAVYNPIKQLSASLSGTYTGKMLVQHMEGSGSDIDKAVQTPDFWDINLKFAYNFRILDFINMEVNAGIKNFLNAYQKDFDKGVERDSGYIYGPSLPRSIFAGLKLYF